MTMLNKAQILQLLEARDGRALRDLWRGRSAVDIAALLDTVEDPRRQAALFRKWLCRTAACSKKEPTVLFLHHPHGVYC